MIECGLYIHIPFCEKRCAYCSFFSSIIDETVKNKYIEEILNEITLLGKKNKNLKIKTIYIGGGTPSLLTLYDMELIFDKINSFFILDNPEITIEINPNSSIDIEKYPSFGINRISIGIQTLNDIFLKKLGRLHSAELGLATLEKAAKYFNNVSVDLIIGIDKSQSPEKDAERIVPYIQHLSAYMLTVEDGTKLQKDIAERKIFVADDDETINQYEALLNKLAKYGINRYETSNFCKEGFESKHNSSYWNLTPYLGIGAGAHSYFNGERYFNVANLEKYINGNHSGNDLQISERKKSIFEDKFEYVMLRLRTVKGINYKYYKEKFGTEFLSDYNIGIKKAEEYLSFSENNVSILPKYFLVQNEIIRSVLNL